VTTTARLLSGVLSPLVGPLFIGVVFGVTQVATVAIGARAFQQLRSRSGELSN
jgi:hypothetical protein